MKKKINTPTLVNSLIAVSVFIIFAVIAGLYDLEINKALYNTSSLYGQYFANIGELPLFLFAQFACVILLYQTFFENKKKNIAYKMFFIILTYIACFVTILYFWRRFVPKDFDYKYAYILTIAIIQTFFCISLGKFFSKHTMNKLLWFALFIIVVLAVSNILVQIMKALWARQRFRTMTSGNPSAPALLNELCPDYKGFTPWYRINVFSKPTYRNNEYMHAFLSADKDAFKSFPSGHTVAAASTFSLIILPDMFEKIKKFKLVCWLVPIVYTILVGISRIVIAAHYLSDILFGGYLGFISAIFARILFKKFIPFFKKTDKGNSQNNILLQEPVEYDIEPDDLST